jgi:hypothetical protein
MAQPLTLSPDGVTMQVDPFPAQADLDDAVEDVGMHDPLMSFPSSVEEDTNWGAAVDAMIAAKLISPAG